MAEHDEYKIVLFGRPAALHLAAPCRRSDLVEIRATAGESIILGRHSPSLRWNLHNSRSCSRRLLQLSVEQLADGQDELPAPTLPLVPHGLRLRVRILAPTRGVPIIVRSASRSCASVDDIRTLTPDHDSIFVGHGDRIQLGDVMTFHVLVVPLRRVESGQDTTLQECLPLVKPAHGVAPVFAIVGTSSMMQSVDERHRWLHAVFERIQSSITTVCVSVVQREAPSHDVLVKSSMVEVEEDDDDVGAATPSRSQEVSNRSHGRRICSHCGHGISTLTTTATATPSSPPRRHATPHTTAVCTTPVRSALDSSIQHHPEDPLRTVPVSASPCSYTETYDERLNEALAELERGAMEAHVCLRRPSPPNNTWCGAKTGVLGDAASSLEEEATLGDGSPHKPTSTSTASRRKSGESSGLVHRSISRGRLSTSSSDGGRSQQQPRRRGSTRGAKRPRAAVQMPEPAMAGEPTFHHGRLLRDNPLYLKVLAAAQPAAPTNEESQEVYFQH